MSQSLRQALLNDRYVVKVDGIPIESTWSEVATRVARGAAKGDPSWVEDAFRDILEDMRFVPAGRQLSAVGSPYNITSMNCYVLPSPEDSRHGILDSLRDWIEIQSRGGGVGINMSSLRPRGSIVRSVSGTSSGPLAWMELFSVATHRVVQQGGSRRGAAMIMLDDSHPDIFEFIDAKRRPGILLGANLSVAISDDFMRAVKENDIWDLKWNDHLFRSVPSRELWNAIIASAWASGEPGVVFLERANKESNSSTFERLCATNPCSEQILGPYGACLLGSVNLLAHVKDGVLDEGLLAHTVQLAVRFMDNVIDRSFYPSSETHDSMKKIRRMGLGTIGLADALIACGLRYGSPEAIAFTEQAFKMIKINAYLASVELAREKGPFPAFVAEDYLDRPFIKGLAPSIRAGIAQHGIRNCFLTSQAPTGSIAKLAGVWSGIEPYFDRETFVTNRLGLHKVAAPDSPYVVFANDLTPEQHIDMMAAAQRHIDSAVSKTVNAPTNHSLADTGSVYTLAYDKGLKSVAYYRDRSRSSQVQWHTAAEAEGAIPEWGGGACTDLGVCDT